MSGRKRDDQPGSEARRKQMIAALIIGAAMGIVLAVLTQFWAWIPAGVAMGLATGAIMKPPADQ